MGKSLEHTAGGKLQTILARMSSTVPRGFFLGLAVTAVMMPLNRLLVKLAEFSVPDEKHTEETVLLDDRLLATPAVAVQRAPEDETDRYEDALGTYMVKLSSRRLNMRDNRTLNTILYSIADVERIADYALSVAKAAQEIHVKKIRSSATRPGMYSRKINNYAN